MKPILFLLSTAIAAVSCMQSNPQSSKGGQQPAVGGGCEGCEVIYESPVPFDKLPWVGTLPDFGEAGPKLVISGTVYKSDGITPAKDVVLYVYHTDQSGQYANRFNEEGYAGRHGYIKGWVKTNEKGQYRFLTLKPASYPNSSNAAHIHPVVKEPGKGEYWIDEYLFDVDPCLTETQRAGQQGRGGSGILRLTAQGGVLHGIRDIYLGRNIPNYAVGK